MVFIAIAAVKAAKVAHHEYVKDKKRNEMIQTVNGATNSAGESVQQNPSSQWWGDEPRATSTSQRSAQQQQQQSEHTMSAWSRDATLQHFDSQLEQLQKEEQQRPTSVPLDSSSKTTVTNQRPTSAPPLPIQKVQKPLSSSSSTSSRQNSVSPTSSVKEESHSKPVKSIKQKQKNIVDTKPKSDGSFQAALRTGTLPPSRPIPAIGGQSSNQPTDHSFKNPNTSAFDGVDGMRKRTSVMPSTTQPSLKDTRTTVSAFANTSGTKRTNNTSSRTKSQMSSTTVATDQPSSAFQNTGFTKKKMNPTVKEKSPTANQRNLQHTSNQSASTSTVTSSMSAAGTMKKKRSTPQHN